jgi:hypothetical protein
MPVTTRFPRSLVALALLSLALGASLGAPRLAHAQLVGCQTDPILLLSNGTELDLHASIDDSGSDVRQVIFTVHAPTGTHLLLYTPGLLGPKEVVQFAADQNPGHYTTTTQVDTGTAGVGVTATTQALGLIGVALVSASGTSQQPLSVSLDL